MLDDPAARAAWARKNVLDSAGPEPLDERDALARDVLGPAAVRLNIPLRSVTELRRHVRMIIGEMEAIAASLDRGGEKDQTMLFGAGGRIRALSKKLNAYRTPRKWD